MEAEVTLQGVVADVVEEAVPVPEPETGHGPGQTDPGLSDALEPVEEVPPEQWTFSEEPPGSTEPPRDEPACAGAATRGMGPATRAAAVAPSAELFGTPGDLGDSGTFRSSAALGVGTESAADAPPSARPPFGPTAVDEVLSPSQDRMEAASPGAPQELSDALGRPEEWDLLPPDMPEPHPVDAVAPAAPVAQGERERGSEQKPTPAPPTKSRPRPWFLPERPFDAAAWLLVLGLVGWGGLGVSRSARVPPAVKPAPVFVESGGVRAEGVRTRGLENLYAGGLLVVDGLVEGGFAPRTGLRVRLLDRAGQPIPRAAAWAGAALDDDELREGRPSDLRARLAESIGSLVEGGYFQAVFPDPPPDAYGISIAMEPMPELPSPTDDARAAVPPR